MDSLPLIWARLKALEYLIRVTTGGLVGNAFLQGGNAFGATAVLGTTDANNLNIITNNSVRATFDQLGNLIPPADATGQIGTAARRWNLVRAVTVTTGDLVMLDDAGEAHWTLKEHAEKIYARNQKTGDVFELLMKKVPHPPDVDGFAEQQHGADARALAEAQRLDEEAADRAKSVVEAIQDFKDAPLYVDNGGFRDDGHAPPPGTPPHELPTIKFFDSIQQAEPKTEESQPDAPVTREQLLAMGWIEKDGILEPPVEVDDEYEDIDTLEGDDDSEVES